MYIKFKKISVIVLFIFASFSIALLPKSSSSALNQSISWSISSSDLSYLDRALRDLDKGKFDSQSLVSTRANDPIINKIIRWKKYIEGSPGTTFEEVIDFIQNNPNWPNMDKIRRTAEYVLSPTTPPDVIVNWFMKAEVGGRLRLNEPVTPKGKLILATALVVGKDKYAAKRETIVKLIRDAFAHKDLDSSNQNFIIQNYSEVLTSNDYLNRADMLVLLGRFTDARALYKRIPASSQKLLETRIAFSAKKPNAKKMLSEVPKNMLSDEGLLYERVKNLDNAGKENDAMRLLMNAPANRKYPNEWWKLSRKYIRDFIVARNYNGAYKLAANHSFKEDKDRIGEAEWSAGWIALRYLRKPDIAITHFSNAAKVANGPISESKSSYWLGRAYKAKKDSVNASAWFRKAASNPTVFYGQLSMHELGNTVFNPINPSAPNQTDINSYLGNDLAKATDALMKIGQHNYGKIFIRGAMKEAKTRGERILILRLGMDNKRFDYSLSAARENVLSGDEILMRGLYPPLKVENLNKQRITEPAEEIVLSIIRQESAFDRNAISRAGAAGLMQLMPGTAKDSAKKLNSKIAEFHKILFTETSPAPVKYLAEKMGLCSGALRLPMVTVSDETKKKLDAAFDRFKAK